MPAYNEEATIEAIVRKVMKYNDVHQLIVINDASTDRTPEILKSLAEEFHCIEVIHHLNNSGKTAALKLGFTAISGNVVVIQDADLEHDPEDIPALIGPIVKGLADVVYGSRFLGGPHRVFFFWHYVGNNLLTTLSNMCTDLCLTDMETGYKVFKRTVLDAFTLKSNRFGFEPEFTCKIALNKFRVYEVPISYSGRDYEEGKKIGWKDGVAALWFIFRFRFFS